jgi:hypothetical protein
MGTNIVLRSADGVTWARQSIAAQHEWLSGITYCKGQFVAVSAWGGILTSTDGVSWVQRYSSGFNLYGVAYGNGQFVAVGYLDWTTTTNYQEIYTPVILTSGDGASWVEHQPGVSAVGAGLSQIAYGNGLFVAVGTAYADGSPDSTYATPSSIYAVTPLILTSSDAVNWAEQPSGPEPESLRSIAYGNGQFVAVGMLGHILTSSDSVNWVRHQSGAQLALLSAVTYGDGRFVAVGSGGTILQSGPIVTLGISPTTSAGLVSLSLAGPTGLGYTIQSSVDLISWRDLTNFTSTQATTLILDPQPDSGQAFYRAYTH